MRKGLALILALAGLAVAPSGASASYHLMSISEVATSLGANNSFIELQMYSSGQNLVNGRAVKFYTATGSLLAAFTLNANVANGENQRTILIGDTATPGADFVYDQLSDAISTYGPGGAACFDDPGGLGGIDCVSWGNFTGNAMLPSPAGTPAAAIPVGQSLQRSIAPGCATLLEAGDDTNNSAADFALSAAPSPRSNSVAPTEKPCTGGGDTTAPETTITKAPKAETEKDTAKFKFKSSEPGSTFQCKFDRKPFKSCTSPRKYKNLDEGKHKFKVKATDAAGNTDATAAKAKFKVVDDD